MCSQACQSLWPTLPKSQACLKMRNISLVEVSHWEDYRFSHFAGPWTSKGFSFGRGVQSAAVALGCRVALPKVDHGGAFGQSSPGFLVPKPQPHLPDWLDIMP